MARIDEVRQKYDEVTERLFSDKETFADYLKFAGKFYKLPSAQSMAIYGANPNSVMVADYDTWKRFDRQVRRGTSSIAVLDNGSLKHYFDITQTTGEKMPYQWKLDKDIAAALIEETYESESRRFQSFAGCLNYLGAYKARENLASTVNSLNISEDDRKGFEKSFISMVQYFIAARCELGGVFKYSGTADLSALDMLNSNAEKEKLCEFVQITGKSVLLSMERSINNIIIQGRTNSYGRNKTDMVRGGQEVLSRNQDGERQNVQARPTDVRVSGANGVGADGRGTGSDERGYRTVRGEVEDVYDGEPPRSDTVAARSAEMGLDTQTDRQGGYGVSGAVEETVRGEEPAPDNVHGDSGVGEHARNDDRQGDNGGHSAAISGMSSEDEKIATYGNEVAQLRRVSAPLSSNTFQHSVDTTSQQTKAEEYSPAFSLSADQKYVADKTAELLGYSVDKAVFDKIYNGVYAYAYGAKTPIQNIPDDELNDVIFEIASAITNTEIPDDLDKVYVDRENETVKMVYYNPDSTTGGQLVYNEFDFDDIADALTHENPIDYILSSCKQTAIDVDMDGFGGAAREFLADTEDFNSRDENYLDKLFALAEPTYTILQLKDGDDMRDYRFADLSELREKGLSVERGNYKAVYSGRLEKGITLEDIYTKFNVDIPDDFHGHSLAVGDVIKITRDGKTEAHYVDGYGFEEIPDFSIEKTETRKAESTDISEQDEDKDNNISFDDILSEVRGGKTVKITEKAEEVQRIADARKIKFTNIRLQYNEDNGFHLTADTDMVKGAIITVFGQNENAVRDYLSENAEHTELSHTRHIATVNGTGYYVMDKALSNSTLAEIREECDKYVITAPSLSYPEDTLAEHNITFLKIGRDITENVFEKNAADIVSAMDLAEKAVLKGESSLHFGLLGNGITVYDVSKWDNAADDYPTVAHISNEGAVKYYVDKNTLGDEDIFRIENEAASVKQQFAESWEKLPVDIRYSRIWDKANALSKPQWDIFFADKTALSMEETVKKYEHALIYGDEDFPPEAKRTVTAYKVGDFYEVFNEDAQTAADFLNLTQTKRNGVPMAGFPAHVYEDYRRKFAMNGYYLKIGDEREIEKIFSAAAKAAESTITKSPDELKVGDLVRGNGEIWRITKIDGEFSVTFENINKASNLSVQSIWGHWKEQFFNTGYEYVSPAELSLDQLSEIEQSAATKKNAPQTSKTSKKSTEEYGGEQLSLFGETISEVENAEKTIINGVDVEQALNDDIISSGTMFRDGKFRIEEYYRTHKGNTNDFAKIIAKEYGTGGHTVGGFDGRLRAVNYDKKGLEIVIRLENGESTRVNWSWKKIADRIAALIDKQKYITQEDIDERIKNARYEYNRYEKGSEEHEQAAKILDMYGVRQNAPLDRTAADNAEELEKGDNIRLDGEEWTVRSVGDTHISLTNSDGKEQNFYNAPNSKWYDTLNSRGFEFISVPDEPLIENEKKTDDFSSTLMSDESEIPETAKQTAEDNFPVKMSITTKSEESINAIIDVALGTGAAVKINDRNLRYGDHEIDIDTWESRADEIKKFALNQGADVNEHGVFQVVIDLGIDGGLDEGYDYRFLDKAIQDAQERINNGAIGAAIYNLETKKIEFTIGEFDVERSFFEDVLKANGYPAEEKQTDLERAKELINDFCDREYGEVGDFTDLTRVPIAYTTDEETDLPINVFADLENKRIISQFNNVTVRVDEYKSLKEMNDLALSELNFDELILDTISYKTPTITCEWSESSVFEEGKTYSVAEFDAIMKKADDKRVAGKNAAIKYYGSEKAWIEAEASRVTKTDKFGDYFGYDKTSFTVNMPDGNSFTERQDIGDGYGGVIDFLRRIDKYKDIVPLLENAQYEDNADRVAKLNDKYDWTVFSEKNYEEITAAVKAHNYENRHDVFSIKGNTSETAAFPLEIGIAYSADKWALSYDLFDNEVGDIIQVGHFDEDKIPDYVTFVETVDRAVKAKLTETLDKSAAQTEQAHSEETEKSLDIKNLAQLKRALTVGAEFEIKSHWKESSLNQRRQVKYADTTGIYSIRPDAPDDKINSANGGRGSYLDWGKASDWEFKNGTCTLYNKGFEHTSENMIMSLVVKPRVIEKHQTEIPVEKKPMQREVKATDFAQSMGINVVDMSGEHIPETDKKLTVPIDSPIVEKLSNVFSSEMSVRLYDAFENSKMPDWNGNSAKINRIKKALYDIIGSEEKTEQAFNIISATLFNAKDFTITDEHLGEGGAKAKFAANIAAIQTLKNIDRENRLATPEEQETLSKYVGWGGLPQAFDRSNGQWAKEYEQLSKLLTDDEYRAASASVLNAHYTTPTVIRAIYKGIQNLGFEGGNILEPAMGVGNFFGAMPDEMRKNSNLSGVELDSITGRIAKQLYPTADIQIKGFEKTDFSDNFFDVVVGNVPFGSYGISDKRYNRENFFIHDYFIAKSLDKVAPGGIVAVVTTKGTLDKENPRVREYLAKRADLVGAVRLPNNAFKANAGTEVTSDILFFQKRKEIAVELPDWCYVSENADGIPVNNYFIDHPQMILGTMKQGMEFSMYGNDKETACVPIEGAVLSEQLEKAVANLKLDKALRIHKEQREREAGVIPARADVRNFTFAEVDGKMYFRENNIMTEVVDKNNNPILGKKLERLKAMNGLRQTFRAILTAQENDCSDEQLQTYQKTLNSQYDNFVKNYGYINDSVNFQAFGKDDDYNSLCALEVIDEETKTVTKSDFFSKRTVKHVTEITHVDTPQEAMYVAMDTLGKLDFEYMAKLCGKEPSEVVDALKAENMIYLNPYKANSENDLEGWEETSEYLSGNVRIKLKAAEVAAKDNPAFQRNVAALTAVIPKRIEAGEISARIGVHWVDVKDYQDFLTEYAKARFTQPLRRAVNGEYKIERKGWDQSAAATQIYGTKRLNSLEIFENLLNCRDVVVRDKKYDPNTDRDIYVINKKETELAQDKANKMKDAFSRWLWADPDRREKYVTRYNELFNSIVGRKYDGSHQTFPGMSPYIKLKPHQLDAIARAKFGGNALLAHCVGAGKSFEMVAATMEKKRLGMINKACVVVPKNLVGQMANEWLRLYPQAKILTATEKDFDKAHRQKFIGRCCTGEYDAVIMSYEQFEKTSMSFEYRRDFIQREIDTLTEGIEDLNNDYRTAREDRSSIKDMERVKKSLEKKLEKLIHDNGKIKDTSLNFEQLGFDSIVVDEAHNYKNGLVVTKMNRVAGVQTTPAQKSEDILMKTQYLNENYGERNIIFATGTPVSNSMVELYIMQRYLRPSLLAQAGMQTFDDWANTFGEVVSKAELKPAGNGYRTKKRFAKFNNLPELMAMYKEFADIRTADMLNLPVPEVKGGKPETIVATTNDFQKAYMQILAERSEAVHNGSVEATVDNMLKITGEARLLGLDARCLNPDAENYPDSKVNLCIDKVMEIYTRTTAQKGVQAIFCDIAVNGDNEQEELTDDKKKKTVKPNDEGKFSVYNYIKAELIRRGIPKDEICFAGDANTTKQQNEMKAQLRSGTKRIVIASTSKLGTGANIQNKLVALHNLDIPWKPSDLEQRVGRIVRQGNENSAVELYNYVTKDTFDAYMMNIIVTKQKFISQLMSGDTSARSCEDVDEMVLNYTEMQALATGDPRIKEKIELDTDVARLKMLESEYYNEQYRLDDTIKDAEIGIKNLEHNISAAKADIEFAKENVLPSEEFRVEIRDKVFTERKAAGEALRQEAVAFLANDNGTLHLSIGNFRGFELAIERGHDYLGKAVAEVAVRHGITYTAAMEITGDIGNVTRLENLVNDGIGKKLAAMEDKLVVLQGDLKAALESKGKPFEHAEELETKSKRLTQLNLELEVGKADEVIMDEKEDEDRDSPRRDNPENDRDKPKPSRGRH